MSSRLVSSRRASPPLGLAAAAAAAVVVLAGCGGAGDGPKCQPGFNLCGDTCVSELDDAHCGACGVACQVNFACTRPPGAFAPACVQTCASRLTNPYDDESGTWHGTSQAAVTYAIARQECEIKGARLPTASEAAKAVRGGAGFDKTGTIWTATPDGPGRQFAVDLTGPAAASRPADAVTTVGYRCLCPSEAPPAFAGSACFGPPGAVQCATPGNGDNAFDAQDRIPLTKAGAVWECAFVGARLTTPVQLAEAISLTPPLGTGSNDWLHTGDDTAQDRNALARFGTLGFAIAGSGTANNLTNALHPFRCAGLRDPAAIPAGAFNLGIHFDRRSGLQAHGADVSTALTYREAVSACWLEGGHLPTTSELGALVNGGLPMTGSSQAPLSCSDTLYNVAGCAGGWCTPTFKWFAGTPPVAGFDWAGTLTAVAAVHKGDTTTARAYRCIWYPLKAGYVAPTSCQGASGCASFFHHPVGRTDTTVWYDTEDRGGTTGVTFLAAVQACAALGGHLPSMRDYTEVIMRGLSGSNTALWTADTVYDGAAATVTWQGTANGTFSGATAGALGFGSLAKYRCMWTNELR